MIITMMIMMKTMMIMMLLLISFSGAPHLAYLVLLELIVMKARNMIANQANIVMA